MITFTVTLWCSTRKFIQAPIGPVDDARTLALLGRVEEAERALARLPGGSLASLLARQDPLFADS